jgi:hypothetical protein
MQLLFEQLRAVGKGADTLWEIYLFVDSASEMKVSIGFLIQKLRRVSFDWGENLCETHAEDNGLLFFVVKIE